jgi:glyoxylase-like metal-dependent hydrolase (beta-lactamase superfamily II)
MREVLPGLYHWTAVHPKIHVEVSSYWLDDPGVLVDPLVPPDAGIEWFAQRSPQPRAIVLSNRHHYRDSARFVEAFGCEVLCNRAGLHEFTHGEDVSGFDIGEPLPGDLLACEVDGICPDDTALYLGDARALFFADGLVRGGSEGLPGPLGFVPDSFMDEPERTKQRLLAAFARLLQELTFEHVLLAHGAPVIDDGRAQLQELVDSRGRTAFAM